MHPQEEKPGGINLDIVGVVMRLFQAIFLLIYVFTVVISLPDTTIYVNWYTDIDFVYCSNIQIMV